MLTLIVAGVVAAQGFVPIGSRDQVNVFQRPNAPAIELMAEGEIAAPPSDVQAALVDVGSHRRMVDRLAESRVLRRGASELYVYQRLKLPVVSDRDYTLRVSWSSRGEVLTVQSRVDNRFAPNVPRHVVRMSLMSGYWELTPIRGGLATRARYVVSLDFAGSVPRWMVRNGAAKDLPRMFAGLRRLVAERRAARR